MAALGFIATHVLFLIMVSLVAGCRLLIAMASLVVEYGL